MQTLSVNDYDHSNFSHMIFLFSCRTTRCSPKPRCAAAGRAIRHCCALLRSSRERFANAASFLAPRLEPFAPLAQRCRGQTCSPTHRAAADRPSIRHCHGCSTQAIPLNRLHRPPQNPSATFSYPSSLTKRAIQPDEAGSAESTVESKV